MRSVAKYRGMPWVLALAILLSVPFAAPRAEDIDPFQTDGVWKSFDRYKDEQKEIFFSQATGNLDADSKTMAAQDATEIQNETQDADNKTVNTSATTLHTLAGDKIAQTSGSILAPPDRPLDLPIMPSLTTTASGLGLSVDTAEDSVAPLPHVANIEADPELQLPKQNWLEAAEAARLHAEGKDSESGRTPVSVRLSFLPGVEFTAPKSKTKSTMLAVAKPPAPPPPASKATADAAAACAAIDAYKKRQLEAIQSDRHTLSALQDAIAELGLQKQLNFMANGDAKIDVPAAGGTPAPGAP